MPLGREAALQGSRSRSEIQLEPDAALPVSDHAPAARERVQEREPSARLALRAWHHDVAGDEATAAVADLDADMRVGDVDGKTHADVVSPAQLMCLVATWIVSFLRA